MGDSYHASCYPSEVVDQRMEDASQESCCPNRRPEYLMLSPYSIVNTDDSDATVDKTYRAICLRQFEDNEDNEEW